MSYVFDVTEKQTFGMAQNKRGLDAFPSDGLK